MTVIMQPANILRQPSKKLYKQNDSENNAQVIFSIIALYSMNIVC